MIILNLCVPFVDVKVIVNVCTGNIRHRRNAKELTKTVDRQVALSVLMMDRIAEVFRV